MMLLPLSVNIAVGGAKRKKLHDIFAVPALEGISKTACRLPSPSPSALRRCWRGREGFLLPTLRAQYFARNRHK